MSLHSEPANLLGRQMRAVRSAGIELPAGLAAVRERLDAFTRIPDSPITSRLVDAIIDGADVDLELLWAAALAEAVISDRARNDLITGVRNSVSAVILQRYAEECGTENYLAVAKAFNAAAKQFTMCAQVIDPNAPAEHVIELSDKERKSWRDAETHANALTGLLSPLKAAAELADIDDDIDVIALTIDPNGCDRSSIVAAWNTEESDRIAAANAATGQPFTVATALRTRCGKWGALHRVGAVIAACDPADYPNRVPCK